MIYRSTSFSLGKQAIRFAGKYSSNIANYQKQITSGLRLHRPSDDPIAFRQSTALAARLEQLKTETSSINDTKAKLNVSVSQLTDANNLITNAKVLAQQGVQANSSSERNALAVEAESLLKNMQNIANTKVAGAYLYSGTRTNVRPFTFDDPTVAGGPLSFEYAGSSQHSRAYVGESVALDTFYPGNDVFGASGRTESVLTGKSGAQLGTGTDNLIGRATLQIRHTATTYDAGSGIAAGTSSATKDTVIGPLGNHSVMINDTSGNGTAGTISLDGGTAIPFSSSDSNLEVAGPNGQKVFVDVTAITPGFSGTVDLQGQGTLSVDGGLTTVPIDFSDSQTITDSTTGRFVHIDSRSITKPGDDYLDFPGTSNIIQTLHELVQDLRNTRNLGNTELAASLDRRLAELGAASDHLLDSMGHQAASLQTLQQLDYRVQDLELETEEQLNNVQATDIAEAVLRMQNDQALLEYTYAVTAEITSVGLIDFLR
jgi:flagellar hook-associated protein 3